MFELLSVPAIDKIFYLLKRSEAFASANITSLVLSILHSLKRPYKYLQTVEFENCQTYNFLKFYVRFLPSFVYPNILKSRSFSRCYTNKSSPKYASLALFNRFFIHRLCITRKLSEYNDGFFNLYT